MVYIGPYTGVQAISATGTHIRLVLIALALSIVGGYLVWPKGQAIVLAPAATEQKAAAENIFAPHKALYQIDLLSSDSGAGITDVRGEMFYQQDDACDAWTSEHRFNVVYHYPEREPMMSVSRYATWEAKDGSRFYFNSDRREDGEEVEALRGSAEKNADGTGLASYAMPEKISYPLSKGFFLPTAQTNEIIHRAQRGDKFFSVVVFDGTDAEGPVQISTFIGKPLTSDERGTIAAISEKTSVELLDPAAWHVRMAVFPLEGDSMSPIYEMDMVLHANGVVSHAIVDYKSFKVEQKLIALEPVPLGKC